MKPTMELERHGLKRVITNAFLAKTKRGYYLVVTTKDKRPECNCFRGRDKKGFHTGITFFSDDGMESIKVYGKYDAILYSVRYGATVILLPDDYFMDGTAIARLSKEDLE